MYNSNDSGVNVSSYQYLDMKQSVAYGRSAVGKYWMNTEMSEANVRERYSVVRTFTAPRSGQITITAADKSGRSRIIGINKASNTHPLHVRIMQNGEKIWPQYAEYAIVPRGDTPVEGAVKETGALDFEPMTLNVQEGDALHFEFADTNTGNTSWDMAVYWDPVITYNEMFHPTVVSVTPEDGSTVAGNVEFAVTFAEEIAEPDISNVTILTDEEELVGEKMPRVKEVSLDADKKTMRVRLSGDSMLENTSYIMCLSDIRRADNNEPNSFEHQVSFTTDNYVIYGDFSRSGTNVVLDVNNTLTEPVSVTVIAVVCQGTPEKYRIVSARYETLHFSGEREITVNLGTRPEKGQFVKAVAVTKPKFGAKLTKVTVLN